MRACVERETQGILCGSSPLATTTRSLEDNLHTFSGWRNKCLGRGQTPSNAHPRVHAWTRNPCCTSRSDEGDTRRSLRSPIRDLLRMFATTKWA